ncbi:MAG TPA: hypothetical protein VHE35_30740 [Kofleriaceae bacterium]|nr:hypothetical protein [Kofleriaceae bacterium]
MGSTAARALLLGFLVPTIAVFVISYRHALRTWLAPPAGPSLPVATIARHRANAGRVSLARRVHAAIIATAFASVFTMGLIAAALVAIAIAGA